jgi:hypothetical protein
MTEPLSSDRSGGASRNERPRPQAGPHWDVRVNRDGGLTATLAGFDPPFVPPITISAQDIDSLRKQVRHFVMRAML